MDVEMGHDTEGVIPQKHGVHAEIRETQAWGDRARKEIKAQMQL